MSSKKKPARRKRKANSKAVAKPYEPTEHERTVIDDFQNRREAKPAIPSMKVNRDQKGETLGVDHPDDAVGGTLLANALGSESVDFVNGLIDQIAQVANKGHGVRESDLNFMLSVIAGVEPRDQMEAMLVAQMAATHMATMSFASRLTSATTIYEAEAAEKAFTKLARTFTTQMEALNRYRGKGQQKMTVEHVHVNDGGQAIIGDVNKGGGA